MLVAHAARSQEVLATRWYVRTIVYGIYVYRPRWPCSSLKGIAWPNPIALTLSRSVARVNLGRPRGVPLFRYIPEAGTLRHSIGPGLRHVVSLSAIAEESDRPRGRTIGLVGLSIGPTHAYCSRAMVLLYLGRVASPPPCRLLSFVYFLFCV